MCVCFIDHYEGFWGYDEINPTIMRINETFKNQQKQKKSLKTLIYTFNLKTEVEENCKNEQTKFQRHFKLDMIVDYIISGD